MLESLAESPIAELLRLGTPKSWARRRVVGRRLGGQERGSLLPLLRASAKPSPLSARPAPERPPSCVRSSGSRAPRSEPCARSRRSDPRGVGPSERPFAWVAQDAPIIAGSLEDNVTLGRADPEAVGDALELVGATKLAREWRDVRLGATGRPVSGGERKWIALARAIATGLPVLLLDEPTAGLDAASRALVLGALAKLRKDRTIILVSHDAEVIAAADRVVAVGSELREEPRVVFEHQADVGDAVAEHRDALDADAEGEAGVRSGSMPQCLEDDGVDHPAAENLDPAGVLADAAARARAVGLLAEDAADVDLGAGLDEGEVARAKAHRRAGAVEALGERGEHALELGEAHVLVDEEALDLVEHRRVGRRRRRGGRRGPALTTAIGGLRRDHLADLHVARVRAEKDAAGVRPRSCPACRSPGDRAGSRAW